MRDFVVLSDQKRDPSLETAAEVKRYLENQGKCVRIETDPSMIPIKPADAVIVLGGDGTVIQAAKQVAGRKSPILGVNFGTLGFLTEVEKPKLGMALSELVEGHYSVEERMALTCTIQQDGKIRQTNPVINEFVVCKRDFGHMITVSVYAGDEKVDIYEADGILISTPTGSTAYNLSAQGPILTPDMEALIVTPICPHSFNKKPLVLSSASKLRIVIEKTKADFSDEASIRGDGILLGDATSGDEFRIQKADQTFGMIHIGDLSFYDKMRGKLA